MYLVNQSSPEQSEPQLSSPGKGMPGGVAGFMLACVQHWRAGVKRQPARRHMRVLESLTLAPRKQVFLVTCDGQRFLIGSGADGVQSIVRVQTERTAELREKRRGEELC